MAMRRIAVVGAGIAGLAVARDLARSDRVTLFEAGDHFGGHAHTVDFTLGGRTHGVDTAFVVYNERAHPNVAALARLVRFDPYIAGPTFTQADCAAWASFGVVTMATQAIYGEDLLSAGGVDWKPYAKRLAERASVQKVVADRKAAQDRAAARA